MSLWGIIHVLGDLVCAICLYLFLERIAEDL